jgi:hypothetical protein
MRTRNPTPNIEHLRTAPPGGVRTYDELRRLMPRDRRLLRLIGKHQVFTTEHITALAFDNQHTARNRLNQLRQRGFLARFRDAVRPGSASWRWTLDLVGATWLADVAGEAPPRLATVSNKINKLASSPQLTHLLACNGLFVDLIAHTREHPETRLSRWWSAAECRQVTGDLVRPDGHGLWTEHDTTVSFWLEQDQGTEKTHRVAAKLAGYDALLRETKRHDAVLVRVVSARAERSLHTHLARHPAVTGGRLLVATSTSDTHPAAQVWQPAGHDDRYRLADLSGLLTDRP